MKVCPKCGLNKEDLEFYQRIASKDGLQKICKICSKQAVSNWKKHHPLAHSEQQKRYHEKHKNRINTKTRVWKKDNWHTYKNYLQARKKRVKQATPSWSNLDLIEVFYANRPLGCHVDHIIPIAGKNVCGLHVIYNLQYLPEKENLSKHNK